MLEHVSLKNILFIDIETVPQEADYKSLEDNNRELWNDKARWIVKEDQSPEDVYQRAGIYAEFGKIICISAGFIHFKEDKTREFRLRSFYGHDEVKILEDFAQMLTRFYNDSNKMLCAHNGKEFDFPYLCRRMLVNSIKIPDILNLAGKKPWDVGHLDTMHLWRFGDYKHFTSLKLLANILNIPTPKEDIEGKDIARVYWEEKNLERIVDYCQQDTLAVAQLMLRYKGEDLLQPEDVVIT